jgi:hypothetical protein
LGSFYYNGSMAEQIEVGMTADEARALEGRQWWHAEGWCGHEVEGGRVEWRYADCTVVLEHDGKLWRVVEVRDSA